VPTCNAELQEEAQVYRTKIAGAYDEFPRKSSYSLFAVWIHAGVAGSGHYWAYIRAGKRKRPAAPPAEVEAGTTPLDRLFCSC
jgi:ubiquitin C-terminal hydrolase